VPTPLEGEQLDRLMTYYMPAWQDVYPAHALQEWFNLPVYLENDANAGAIAEKWWGGGRDTHSLAYIKLGVGVGSGLIINDEIYRGYSGAAGEIGHTTIEASGRLCRCGNRGCMESYVGAPGLIADTLAGFERNGYAIENPELLTVEQVVQEGLRGNEVCQAVIQNAGRSLGVAVANLLNLVNPGLVILGGDLVQAGDLLFSTVEESIRERALPIRAIHAPVVASQLGENAIAMGSATIVIQKAFQPSALYHTLGLLERR
jgi:predicted NBD/HSP70 family sugar kinase